MTAELNSGKIGPGATGDMLDKINDLQDKLNQNLPLLNNDLGSVQKKIAALGEVPDDGNEPAEIAKQRKELNKQADAYKTSIAQAKLAKTKIDDLNGLILKVRNQDLFTRIFAKQSSIFHPQEFWTSLVSFAKFTFELIKSPLDWYRQLPAADMATADDNIVYALFYISAPFYQDQARLPRGDCQPGLYAESASRAVDVFGPRADSRRNYRNVHVLD